jgi:hypothetical protein
MYMMSSNTWSKSKMNMNLSERGEKGTNYALIIRQNRQS